MTALAQEPEQLALGQICVLAGRRNTSILTSVKMTHRGSNLGELHYLKSQVSDPKCHTLLFLRTPYPSL